MKRKLLHFPAHSERMFYDISGAGALGIPISRSLELFGDGKWKFWDSAGSWSATKTANEEWSKWGVKTPHRHTIKTTFGGIMLLQTAPLKKHQRKIEFAWAVYHAELPLVQNAGTARIKFTH